MRCLDTAILSLALLLRILVGFHPHSGQDDYQGPNGGGVSGSDGKTPIKYGGDYEAQRHWMEITYHIPISEWYYHDLEYWGLDYPPLTAYVSWGCGWVAHKIGSLHDGAFNANKDDTIINDVCNWDDSVCREKIQKGNSGRTYSKGLGVLKDLVALHSSRWGFEHWGGKLYMRFTVLVLDLLIYMSAMWVLVGRLTKEGENDIKKNNAGSESTATESNKNHEPIIPNSQRPRFWLLLTALSQPALILIDHGHFQYNTVSLGLALWSFHFMTISSFSGPILGSIFFSLALNFKQMELYHAPAIFAYLLGRCFRRDLRSDLGFRRVNNNNDKSNILEAVGRFAALGRTVILTFLVLWLPFAIYPQNEEASKLDGIIQIIRRLFPFQRGIFEGKVANIWCALSIKPFSIRDRLPAELLPLAALGLTLALVLPPCWMLFEVGRGSNSTVDGDTPPSSKSKQVQKLKEDADMRLLLWGTTSTSLAFFLASFQVHEKGILIPLAPISLLMLDAPHFVHFFSILATWSLWPLLVIDRLTDAYVCSLVFFLCINSMARVPLWQLPFYDGALDIFSDRYITKYIPTLSWVIMILLHVAELLVEPPSHLPDLFPVLWSFVGCGLFCISYLATLWAMSVHSKLWGVQGKIKAAGKRVTWKNGIPPVSVLFGVLLISCAKSSEAFCLHLPFRSSNIYTAYTVELHSSSGNCGTDGIITKELIDQARLPLNWEVQSAREAKPVLNLSTRNSDMLSLADGAGESFNPAEDTAILDEYDQDDGESWENGEIWQVTEQELVAMGIVSNEETETKLTSQKVLSGAPQLLRLPTSQIVESARFLLSYPYGTNSTSLLEQDISLLTYYQDDLQYGLEEYLTNMMFMGNVTLARQMIQTQLSLAPSMALQLVRMGVEGGIEERSVSRALGNAGQASGKAVEGIIGEAGNSYREWKRVKGGKSSLG